MYYWCLLHSCGGWVTSLTWGGYNSSEQANTQLIGGQCLSFIPPIRQGHRFLTDIETLWSLWNQILLFIADGVTLCTEYLYIIMTFPSWYACIIKWEPIYFKHYWQLKNLTQSYYSKYSISRLHGQSLGLPHSHSASARSTSTYEPAGSNLLSIHAGWIIVTLCTATG